MNGTVVVRRADDYEQVRSVAEYYSDYKMCFEGAGTNPGEKTLEDKFFEYEVGQYSSTRRSQRDQCRFFNRKQPNFTLEMPYRDIIRVLNSEIAT